MWEVFVAKCWKTHFKAFVISLLGSKHRLKQDSWWHRHVLKGSQWQRCWRSDEVSWAWKFVCYNCLFPSVAHSATQVSLSLHTLFCLNWLGILNKYFKWNSYGFSNCTWLKQYEFLPILYHITTAYQSTWNDYHVLPVFFLWEISFSPLCWVIAYTVNVVFKILAAKVLESY